MNTNVSQSVVSNSNVANSVGSDANTNNPSNTTNSQLQIDDIEIMKQRSANNNTFLCIKITEIQLLVSYKGGDKEKNLKDLNNVSFLFPLFEVHDKTWTWLDLINALKSHVKKALLSQAIKHKLIKIPIQQPVNRLISMSRRNNSLSFNGLSNSYATGANLDSSNMGANSANNSSSYSLINQSSLAPGAHYESFNFDEQEKMTIIKLFGTKLIEKKSQIYQPSNTTANSNLLIDGGLVLNPVRPNKTGNATKSSHEDQEIMDQESSIENGRKKKPKLAKKIFNRFKQ